MRNKWLAPRVILIAAAVLTAVIVASCRSGMVDDSSDNPSADKQSSVTESKVEENTGTVSADSIPEEKRRGFVEAGNNTGFYFADGELKKGGIVGSDSDGYYYADDEGKIDLLYCDAVNANGADWNVIEGKATKVKDESDTTLNSALKAVAKCTNSKMNREEKLRAAFDYIKTAYLEGVPHDPPYKEMDWPIVCANDLFINGKGDCYSYGAAFAYYAKAIGYTECYACNSGGHGWAEVDGKFYDPEWDMHHQEYNHFGVAPEDSCDVDYTRGLAPGAPWMRIKV